MGPTESEAYSELRQRMMDQLRDPLLIAVEREWSRMIKRENIVLSRAAYSPQVGCRQIHRRRRTVNGLQGGEQWMR